jgi:hypothetical protein
MNGIEAVADWREEKNRYGAGLVLGVMNCEGEVRYGYEC